MMEYTESIMETHFSTCFLDNLEVEKQVCVPKHTGRFSVSLCEDHLSL